MVYDFVIIGGGIIGASTAMQLQQQFPDSTMLLVEKEAAPAQHQTGHNSGVIHAGIYYQPGSLKADFCKRGNTATKQFCDQWNIPYRNCGKLLVATNAIELERLRALWQRSEQNGIERYWIDQQALQEREPNIRGLAGIFVPSSGIVDYSLITRTLLNNFRQQGGECLYNAEVTGIDESTEQITIGTHQRPFKTRYLICCGGLQSDRLATLAGLNPDFSICPFRGEYYQLAAKHSKVVSHLIYPVPDPAMPFLGVHLTPMIDGSITVGPNAVLAGRREGYQKGDIKLRETLRMLTTPGVMRLLARHFRSGLSELKNSRSKSAYLHTIHKYCPSLSQKDLLAYPAGVRAQAVSHSGAMIDDFLFLHTKRSFHVCNAPSPAATSALPIGEYIVEKVRKLVGA